MRPVQTPDNTATPIRHHHQTTTSTEGKDAIGLYLDAISRTPLLTAEDEVELAKRIEAGLFAQQLLDGYAQNHVGATQDELRTIARDGRKAFDHFVHANLRLVVSVARRYGRNAMPLLDLIQEGNTGLLRAVKKFDYSKGFKFSTYATWWIRQAITRGVAQGGHIVMLPVHIAEQINQMASTRMNLTRRLGREPEATEIANEMNTSVEVLQSLLNLSRRHASLDAPLREDLSMTLSDILAGTPQDEDALTSEDRAALYEMINDLDERSADIIRRRYGLIDGTIMKLADIGDVWGITAERVRQIERAALLNLQNQGWGQDGSSLDDVNG